MNRSPMRPVARLARRTARREWKRTALVMALVAVAVAASIMVTGMVRASTVRPEQWALADFGAGDVRITLFAADSRVDQWVEDTVAGLAPGATWQRERSAFVLLGDENVVVTDLDVTHPLTQGRLTLIEGRAPEQAGELAIGVWFAQRHGLGVGERVGVGAGSEVDYEVVGVVRDPLQVSRQVAVVSAAGLDRLRDPTATPETVWLVGGVDGSQFAEAMEARWEAGRRSFLPDPAVWPPPPALAELERWEPTLYAQLTREQIDQLVTAVRTGDYDGHLSLTDLAYFVVGEFSAPEIHVESREWRLGDWRSTTERAIEAPGVLSSLLAALLLAEIALVAGAAYATGARRRLRELGLLGANGATDGQLRAAVLGEAMVAGLLGSAVGIGAGLAAVTMGRPIMQRFVDQLIIGVPVNPGDVIAPAIVGVLAVATAAWLPARTAARVPTTTALQGRMPLSPPPRWVVPAGLTMAGLGTMLVLVAVAASTSGMGAVVVVGGLGVLLMIGGVALLTGPIVARVGGWADRLPATPRLVVRDSARQRTRAAAAMSATMVVLLAPVIMGAATMSHEARQQVWGLREPGNHVLLAAAGADFDASAFPHGSTPDEEALAAVMRILPEAARVDITYLTGSGRLADLPAPPDAPVLGRGGAVGAVVGTPGYDPHAMPVAMGTGEIANTLRDPRIARALADEELVLLGVRSRTSRLVLGEQAVTAVEVPVRVISGMPRVLVPPERMAELGLQEAGAAVLFVAPTSVTDSQRRALWELSREDVTVAIGWEGGMAPGRALLIGVGVALGVVLLIVALVTALAATESDHDLRTIVAVGAPPSMRRRFLGLQTGFYTLTAAALATPLGLLLYRVFASGDVWTQEGPFGVTRSDNLVIPWSTLGLVVIAIPVVVATLTTALARSAPTVPPVRAG